MQTMNPQELGLALQRICAQLPEQQGMALRQFFADSRSRIVGCLTKPAQSNDPGLSWGRIGGSPLLPENFSWPRDRFERPMIFLAQFNLELLPHTGEKYPKSGMLTIFRSLQAAKLNTKDRRAFSISYFNEPEQNLVLTNHPGNLQLPGYAFDSGITWTVTEELWPMEEIYGPSAIYDQALQWAQTFNQLAYCQAQLFGSNIADLELLKQLCSFSANGISYSYKRAADPLYGHLIEQSKEWTPLVRIRELELFGQDSGADESIIMIRKEDLANGHLEKAWNISRGPTFQIEA